MEKKYGKICCKTLEITLTKSVILIAKNTKQLQNPGGTGFLTLKLSQNVRATASNEPPLRTTQEFNNRFSRKWVDRLNRIQGMAR